ncbi:sensor histidine kinase [Anaeromyxobacter oryzae]|nr:ATP-binding protein [Anaeromyxobacter oryzae]
MTKTAAGSDRGAEAERSAGPRAPRPGPVPFLHRLSTKLLGVTAILALAALVALWAADRRLGRALVGEVERSSALLGEALRTTTRDAMLADGPEHAYDVLARIAALEGIDRVRVLDARGRVAFSTVAAERGTVVAKDEAPCAGCHAGRAEPVSRAPADARGRTEVGPRGRRYAMVTPLYNDRACATAACHVHPPGRQVLGLLEIGVSLERVDSGVSAFRVGAAPLLAAGIVLIAVLLYLLGRAEVLGPVAALLEGMRRVSRDELDVEVRVRSRGEMGALAGSFNEMTSSLRALEDALNGVLANLEHEVEARTAELRSAQDQLVRTEKLSALGKLSASVAHEINNPLAGILTFAKLVSRTLAEGPPDDARRAVLQKNLALVEREAQRCSAIVRNLLDFARERPIQRKRVDVNAAIDEALSLIANQVAIQEIALVRELAPLPPVLADFGQLRQAFVNVAMNACEAMGKGGRLAITSRTRDGAVEIAIADTGPGIPPERLGHIFDPFFTTKEKGTGLGLSVVYGIVQRHGGTVTVDSAVGAGTTFVLRLPADQDADTTGPGQAA